MNEKKKAIVVLSGGMDSATLLYWAIDQGYDVEAITVNYGQRHRKEISQACQIAQAARVPYIVVDATKIGESIMTGSALTGGSAVPHGHYAEENMKATLVPNRNMLLLAMATARAVQIGAVAVCYGPHAGDHAIYPDCRKNFTDALAEAIALASYEPIALLTPFVKMTKADIVKLGTKLKVPYALTWTCYEGGEIHCGRCGTCVERLEAFDEAGEVDPVLYRDREYWKEVIGKAAIEKAAEAIQTEPTED